MIFLIFTTLVFIAELIIGFTILYHLFKFDRYLIETNIIIEEAKPKIKSIMELFTKITEQVSELVPIQIKKFNDAKNRILLKQIERVMTVILIWGINKKVLKQFSKSKILKTVWRGLSLLQSVI